MLLYFIDSIESGGEMTLGQNVLGRNIQWRRNVFLLFFCGGGGGGGLGGVERPAENVLGVGGG